MRPKVGLMLGSLRRDSINQRLARALGRLGEPLFELVPIPIAEAPHYNADLEEQNLASVATLREQIRSSDALLFVTPEYNRSIPGVLKNAIDWGSRPYASNAFRGKAAAVIGASPGSIGTAAAQQHLRNILSPLEVRVMGQPEAYISLKPETVSADGQVEDPALRSVLEAFCGKFADWIGKNLQA